AWCTYAGYSLSRSTTLAPAMCLEPLNTAPKWKWYLPLKLNISSAIWAVLGRASVTGLFREHLLYWIGTTPWSATYPYTAHCYEPPFFRVECRNPGTAYLVPGRFSNRLRRVW